MSLCGDGILLLLLDACEDIELFADRPLPPPMRAGREVPLVDSSSDELITTPAVLEIELND